MINFIDRNLGELVFLIITLTFMICSTVLIIHIDGNKKEMMNNLSKSDYECILKEK